MIVSREMSESGAVEKKMSAACHTAQQGLDKQEGALSVVMATTLVAAAEQQP